MNLNKNEQKDFVEVRNTRIIVNVLILLFSLTLIIFGIVMIKNCGTKVEATEGARSGFMFERVCFGIGNDEVVYDKDTKVMYVRYRDSYTLLVNADGTPRLYEEGE